MHIYSRFNVPLDDGVVNDEPSLTQQHFASECDINHILQSYMQTGVVTQHEVFFGDFSEHFDFQKAHDMVAAAYAEFEALPAIVRDRFANDPSMLLDFLSHPENRSEAERLGLISSPEPSSAAPSQLPS